MKRLEVWREEGDEPNDVEGLVEGIDWFCECLLVHNRESENTFHFPILRFYYVLNKFLHEFIC